MSAFEVYSEQGDFPVQQVAIPQLQEEILAEVGITTPLTGIIKDADDVFIYFQTSISGGERTLLDYIISTHIPSQPVSGPTNDVDLNECTLCDLRHYLPIGPSSATKDFAIFFRRFQNENNNSEGNLIKDVESESGTIVGNSSGVIILSSSTIDDYYNNWWIHITDGVGSGQVRRITGYTGSSGTAEVNLAWSITPSNTSSYKLFNKYYAVMGYDESDDKFFMGTTHEFSTNEVVLNSRSDLVIDNLWTYSNVNVSGNIIISGNVDGRDVSVDGAVLDAHVADFNNPHQTTFLNLTDTPNSYTLDKFLKTGATSILFEDISINDLSDVVITNATVNNILIYDGNNWINSSLSLNQPSLQLRSSSNINLTDQFQDIIYTMKDVETNSNIIEHDLVNKDRIKIKETGLYFIRVFGIAIAGTGKARIHKQIRVNDSSVIEGSDVATDANGTDQSMIGKTSIVLLNSGDFITTQAKADPNQGNSYIKNCQLIIIKLQASKGERGPTGSGSNITIQDEGSDLSNTPHSILNFVGNGVNVSDAGGGVATITINGGATYGSEYQYIEDETATSTTSNVFVQKLRLTTNNIPSGNYKISWYYEWRLNSTNKNFNARVQVDDTTTIMNHIQEPSDGTSTQRIPFSGFKISFLSAGVHNIDFDYSTEGSASATLYVVRLEIIRVS